MKELSVSPTVEKCLRITPKGGIAAEVITDKSQLSKRALHTLSRWARMTEDVVQDGYESGYDDDPVQVPFSIFIISTTVIRSAILIILIEKSIFNDLCWALIDGVHLNTSK